MADHEAESGLSEAQIDTLCAVWLGSKGDGSNARTLDSLLRRGLATVRQHQGAPLWETTARGSDLAASIMHPDDEPTRPATEADMRHCVSCTCPVEAARTCRRCGDRIIWHEGNGGQWLGADPPRDWVTCFGRPEGERHEPVDPSTPPAKAATP